MSRLRSRLLVVGFLLALVAAVIGWREAFRQFKWHESSEVRAATKAIEALDCEKRCQALEVELATDEMWEIWNEYIEHHLQHKQWPESPQVIASRLRKREAATKDPWDQPYQVRVENLKFPNGQFEMHPVVYCQPPGDRPLIVVPPWAKE